MDGNYNGKFIILGERCYLQEYTKGSILFNVFLLNLGSNFQALISLISLSLPNKCVIILKNKSHEKLQIQQHLKSKGQFLCD